MLTQFFILSFVISWILWLPGLFPEGELPAAVDALTNLGPFGPGIAAFWLTWRREGGQGMKRLWRRAWRLEGDQRWLLPALLLGPVTTGLTAGATLLLGGSIEWQYALPAAFAVPGFVVIYLTNALPEELGWRGYALGRLQKLSQPLTASLILGALWGLWHLPLHFSAGTVQEAIPVYQFVLQQMALALIYTWLYNHSGGSVLLATLFHTTANLSAALVPFWTTELGRWLNFASLLLTIAVISWKWGWQRIALEADLDAAGGSPG